MKMNQTVYFKMAEWRPPSRKMAVTVLQNGVAHILHMRKALHSNKLAFCIRAIRYEVTWGKPAKYWVPNLKN